MDIVRRRNSYYDSEANASEFTENLRVVSVPRDYVDVVTTNTLLQQLNLFKPLQKTSFKISETCFFCTTWTVMLSAGSNIQPHPGV